MGGSNPVTGGGVPGRGWHGRSRGGGGHRGGSHTGGWGGGVTPLGEGPPLPVGEHRACALGPPRYRPHPRLAPPPRFPLPLPPTPPPPPPGTARWGRGCGGGGARAAGPGKARARAGGRPPATRPGQARPGPARPASPRPPPRGSVPAGRAGPCRSVPAAAPPRSAPRRPPHRQVYKQPRPQRPPPSSAAAADPEPETPTSPPHDQHFRRRGERPEAGGRAAHAQRSGVTLPPTAPSYGRAVAGATRRGRGLVRSGVAAGLSPGPGLNFNLSPTPGPGSRPGYPERAACTFSPPGRGCPAVITPPHPRYCPTWGRPYPPFAPGGCFYPSRGVPSRCDTPGGLVPSFLPPRPVPRGSSRHQAMAGGGANRVCPLPPPAAGDRPVPGRGLPVSPGIWGAGWQRLPPPSPNRPRPHPCPPARCFRLGGGGSHPYPGMGRDTGRG